MNNNASSAAMPRPEILLRPRGASDDSIYPALDDAAAFRDFFDRNGFIVMRRAVDPALCEAAKQAFISEALPDKTGYFKRHASGQYERHVYTEQGFMKYPLLN